MFSSADQARDDFQQMRNELQNITEKLNSHIPSREEEKDEGTREYFINFSKEYTFHDSGITYRCWVVIKEIEWSFNVLVLFGNKLLPTKQPSIEISTCGGWR